MVYNDYRKRFFMSKLVLGLDIGIASVGVGIINLDNDEVVHANSILF